jgi:hypothetical protein
VLQTRFSPLLFPRKGAGDEFRLKSITELESQTSSGVALSKQATPVVQLTGHFYGDILQRNSAASDRSIHLTLLDQ